MGECVSSLHGGADQRRGQLKLCYMPQATAARSQQSFIAFWSQAHQSICCGSSRLTHQKEAAFRAPKVDWKIKTMITSCEDGKRSTAWSWNLMPSSPKPILSQKPFSKTEHLETSTGSNEKQSVIFASWAVCTQILQHLHLIPRIFWREHILQLRMDSTTWASTASTYAWHKMYRSYPAVKNNTANLLQKRKSQLGPTGLALVVGFQLLPKAHLEHTPAPPAAQTTMHGYSTEPLQCCKENLSDLQNSELHCGPCAKYPGLPTIYQRICLSYPPGVSWIWCWKFCSFDRMNLDSPANSKYDSCNSRRVFRALGLDKRGSHDKIDSHQVTNLVHACAAKAPRWPVVAAGVKRCSAVSLIIKRQHLEKIGKDKALTSPIKHHLKMALTAVPTTSAECMLVGKRILPHKELALFFPIIRRRSGSKLELSSSASKVVLPRSGHPSRSKSDPTPKTV